MSSVDNRIGRVKQTATDSLLRTVRTCPKKFVWRYIKELEPIRLTPPLAFGDIGHRLLAVLYDLASTIGDIDTKLEDECSVWVEEHVGSAWQAQNSAGMFADQLGESIDETRDVAKAIAAEALDVVKHYRDTVWEDDLKRYSFHYIETVFSVPLPDVRGRRHGWWRYSGKWDLLAKDLDTGVVWVVDHKFTSRQPDEYAAVLDSDTQPIGYLYAATFLATAKSKHLSPGDGPLWKSELAVPCGFMHNIIRRMAPKEPPLLKGRKKPVLSRAKTLVTTPALYRKAIASHGLDVADYQNVLDRLEKDRPVAHLRRSPTVTPDDIKAWTHDTRTSMRIAAGYMRNPDSAYRVPSACRRLRGRCPYLPLCFGGAEPSLAGFRHAPAHSELESAKEGNDGNGDS